MENEQRFNLINLKNFDVDKLSILDLKATDSVRRRYNIEVQTIRPLDLPKRLAYYAAKQLIEQLGEGDQYADLSLSISICLLNSILFRGVCSRMKRDRGWIAATTTRPELI